MGTRPHTSVPVSRVRAWAPPGARAPGALGAPDDWVALAHLCSVLETPQLGPPAAALRPMRGDAARAPALCPA